MLVSIFIPIGRQLPVKQQLFIFSLNSQTNISVRFLSNFALQMLEILTLFFGIYFYTNRTSTSCEMLTLLILYIHIRAGVILVEIVSQISC